MPETDDNIPSFATGCDVKNHEELEKMFKDAFGDIGRFLHPEPKTPEEVCRNNAKARREAEKMLREAFERKLQECKDSKKL